MATLVLTAVGTILGGPFGAAAGALLGSAIDQQLFPQQGRTGPRLNDLRLQTSTYGTPIPRLYGRMRVAGSVIWSTDLKEKRHKQKGGKGRPSVTTYTYSASFAVAIASRPIAGVRRIWADGNLLRGAGGDFKSSVGAFRLIQGTEDQAVDQLIGSALGPSCPAHRGMAIAVFQDLQLADFGNRIPSLTFEVVADEESANLDEITRDLTDGIIGAPDMQVAQGAPAGFAALGPSVGETLSLLADIYGLTLRDEADGLALAPPVRQVERVISAQKLAVAANGRTRRAEMATKAGRADTPGRVELRHYDPERDFQIGVQLARRPGAGQVLQTLDAPISMSAEMARHRAGERLLQLWHGRAVREVNCGWPALSIRPGMSVSLSDDPGGIWNVEERRWEEQLVRLTLRRLAPSLPVAQGADGGVPVQQPDLLHGPTTLRLAELPASGSEARSAPVVFAAAAGISPGWRRAALFIRSAEDMTLEPMDEAAFPATFGQVIHSPDDGASSLLFDERSRLIVELLNDGMELTGASDLALSQGANLCMVGAEMMQFGRVTPMGGGRYALEHLLRGRGGSEAAMAGHAAGESFLLIEEDRLVPVPVTRTTRGGELTLAAIGIGDEAAALATMTPQGTAMMPLSPVHLRGEPDGQGGLTFRWIRRSRTGWTWQDGADVPLSEEEEQYVVSLSDGGGTFRQMSVAAMSFTYDAAMRAQDMMAGHGGQIVLSVRQSGTFGPGPALTGFLYI